MGWVTLCELRRAGEWGWKVWMCDFRRFINILVIFGCIVLCMLFDCIFFGLFLGSMLMYLCMSHGIYVSKFLGGGCRELVSGVPWLWENWFHSHCSLLVVTVAMYFPLWSYMLASVAYIWMVGWSTCMSLSRLHSYVDSLRLIIFRGGSTNLLSFGCMWLTQLAGICYVLIECYLGVLVPPLCTIGGWCLVVIAIGIGTFVS